MGKAVGVDGCKKGWFVVALSEDGSWDFAVFPHISNVWAAHKDADRILIDIPIGLPDSTVRASDNEARKLLRERASSVFAVPVRDAIYATSYGQAREINVQKTGKSVSKQLWNISPKIREVDALVRADNAARQTLYEAHPELVFKGLAGHEMHNPKSSRAGIAERLRLLENYLVSTHEIYHKAREAHKRNEVEKDDILDAMGLAVAAMLANLQSLPVKPEVDRYGLPMQIVYSQPPTVTRLHHVLITVPSDKEEEARAFYCDLLGMREIRKPDSLKDRGGFWLELGSVQVHVGLEDDVDRTLTRAHIAYQVIDLDHWRSALDEAGIETHDNPPIPGYDRFQFNDPFGNRIEFIQTVRKR